MDAYNNKSNGSIIGQFQQLIAVVMNEGLAITAISEKNYQYDFSYPQLSKGLVQFQDFKIQFLDYGDYMLVFSIDGIETGPTRKITISSVSLPPGTLAAEVLQYIMVVLTFFMVLLTTNPTNRKLWYSIGIVCIVVSILVVGFSASGLVWKILLCVTLAGTLIPLGEVVYKSHRVSQGDKNTMVRLLKLLFANFMPKK